MQGWISLHRKTIEWEWYTDANTVRLFIHCLLKANHIEKNWRGITINRGQFLTSIESLSKELRLSNQKIRTAINKLKSTNEITVKTTSKYSIISIACYDSYQDYNNRDNKPATNQQQTNNKQITTTNNDNNDNNDNKTKDAALLIFTDYGFSDQQIKLIFENRKKNSKSAKSAKITEIIAKSICKEMKLCTEAGYTIDNVLNEWHETSWVAFKSEWIQKRIPPNSNAGNYNGQNRPKQHIKETPLERMEREQKAMDLRRSASQDNGEILDQDGSVISTQVHISGRGAY